MTEILLQLVTLIEPNQFFSAPTRFIIIASNRNESGHRLKSAILLNVLIQSCASHSDPLPENGWIKLFKFVLSCSLLAVCFNASI